MNTAKHEYVFETNLKCGGCVAKVTPLLDASEAVISWKADTAHPSKLLSVELTEENPALVEALLQQAGFSGHVKGKPGLE